MKSNEKEVSYTIKNTYSTLNQLTPKTKKVWIVFHGLGFLSRYFIKNFKNLNPEENYIIAPQAQAKHYLNGKYVHSGACWLTKENTAFEIENVMTYIDRVFEAENIPENIELVVLGFSQGVSIATRWVASRKNKLPEGRTIEELNLDVKHREINPLGYRPAIKCDALFLYAGKVPREFTADDFKHVKKVKLIVGDKDEYITPQLLEDEKAYAKQLFGNRIDYIIFDGAHVVDTDVIASLT